ncbi:MAG TPA: nucleotide kinase domain-containing protein [Candidatus Dojkabacteria bacterium]|nr:nucleotide kinase domain-containing protein [Candidatus Dojkabacteria bacterium]
MEVPNELKNLYNHWQIHTIPPKPSSQKNLISKTLYYKIIQFANERMVIYEKKEQGATPPFTSNEILRKYRFCNIYRELDRQTIEFHTILKSLVSKPDIWLLNMLFSRFICNTQTIKAVGLLNFDLKNNELVYEKLMSLPRPKYGNAYIFPISTIQKSKYDTREKFFCFYLPQVVQVITEELFTLKGSSMSDALDRILPLFGFNLKFHWTETLIDFCYQYPGHIDLYKQFPIGPGSLPTMKRLSNLDPELTCLRLVETVPLKFNYLTFNDNPIYLSAENWEGIGCEYRKYCNLINGGGRKRLFH